MTLKVRFLNSPTLPRFLGQMAEQKPEYYSLVWDRTDSRGRKVACGIYFCDFAAGEFQTRKKFVLVK